MLRELLMPAQATIPLALSLCLISIGTLVGVPALAQAPAPAPAETPASPPAPESMTAPSLSGHPEAPYPAEALHQRVEGNVGLELDLDAGGMVVDVRVTTPAG